MTTIGGSRWSRGRLTSAMGCLLHVDVDGHVSAVLEPLRHEHHAVHGHLDRDGRGAGLAPPVGNLGGHGHLDRAPRACQLAQPGHYSCCAPAATAAAGIPCPAGLGLAAGRFAGLVGLRFGGSFLGSLAAARARWSTSGSCHIIRWGLGLCSSGNSPLVTYSNTHARARASTARRPPLPLASCSTFAARRTTERVS